MIFERSTREQAIEDVIQALGEELGTQATREKAETLCSIADDYSVRPEELVQWIHFRAPGKTWATAEFVRWARKLAESRKELQKMYEREAHEWQKLCTSCFGHSAVRVGVRWMCPSCGEIA